MSEVKDTSAVTLNETNGGKALEIQLTGKLAKEDLRATRARGGTVGQKTRPDSYPGGNA
jgi:hypothetical protein